MRCQHISFETLVPFTPIKNHPNKPMFPIDLKLTSHFLLGRIWFSKKYFPWVNPDGTDSWGARHIMSCCTAVLVPCKKKKKNKTKQKPSNRCTFADVYGALALFHRLSRWPSLPRAFPSCLPVNGMEGKTATAATDEDHGHSLPSPPPPPNPHPLLPHPALPQRAVSSCPPRLEIIRDL